MPKKKNAKYVKNQKEKKAGGEFYLDLKCPDCGRTAVTTARVKGTRSCRRCGNTWKYKQPETKKESK